MQDLLPDKAYAAGKDNLLPAISKAVFLSGLHSLETANKELLKLHFAHAVWWHAPFYSGGGYSSEAVAFMLAMWNSPTLSRKRLWVAQHGDGFDKDAYDVSIAQMRCVNIVDPLLCFSLASCCHVQQINPRSCYCIHVSGHVSSSSTKVFLNCLLVASCKSDKHLYSMLSLCRQICIICCVAQLLH